MSLLTFITTIIALSTPLMGQTIDDMIRGPITGYTFIPELSKSALYFRYSTLSSTSLFDDEGDEESFEDVMDGYASPEYSGSRLDISGEYSVIERMSVGVSLPIILKNEMDYNPEPGYSSYFSNLSGKTGIGDITASTSMLFAKSTNQRWLASVGIILPTGSTIEDLDDDEWSSTGSGHTSIYASICGDNVFIGNQLYGSAALAYEVNQKADFSVEGDDWEEKDGDAVDGSIRMVFIASPFLSIGLAGRYFSQAEIELDGEEIEDSNFSFSQFIPNVGYQLDTGGYTINLYFQARLEISGINTFKSNVIQFGATIML